MNGSRVRVKISDPSGYSAWCEAMNGYEGLVSETKTEYRMDPRNPRYGTLPETHYLVEFDEVLHPPVFNSLGSRVRAFWFPAVDLEEIPKREAP